MNYDWDDAKNQSNLQKHGVSFEEAQTVFDDPLLLVHEDAAAHGEQRLVAIGSSKLHRALFVVFCERSSRDQDKDADNNESKDADEEVIRLISARKLTPSERRRVEPLRLRQLTGTKR